MAPSRRTKRFESFSSTSNFLTRKGFSEENSQPHRNLPQFVRTHHAELWSPPCPASSVVTNHGSRINRPVRILSRWILLRPRGTVLDWYIRQESRMTPRDQCEKKKTSSSGKLSETSHEPVFGSLRPVRPALSTSPFAIASYLLVGGRRRREIDRRNGPGIMQSPF